MGTTDRDRARARAEWINQSISLHDDTEVPPKKFGSVEAKERENSPSPLIHISIGVVYASPGVVKMPPWVLKEIIVGTMITNQTRRQTHWYSDNSVSKSTHSTPTSSRLSSTIVARSWSVANSSPRKSACPVFGTAGIYFRGLGYMKLGIVDVVFEVR